MDYNQKFLAEGGNRNRDMSENQTYVAFRNI